MIFDRFAGLSPILQALLATCFTWAVTALGASLLGYSCLPIKRVPHFFSLATFFPKRLATFFQILSPKHQGVDKALDFCPLTGKAPLTPFLYPL